MLKAELDFLIDVYRYFGGTASWRGSWFGSSWFGRWLKAPSSELRREAKGRDVQFTLESQETISCFPKNSDSASGLGTSQTLLPREVPG